MTIFKKLSSALVLAVLVLVIPKQIQAQELTPLPTPILHDGQIESVVGQETQTYPDGVEVKITTYAVRLDNQDQPVEITLERLSSDQAFPYDIGDKVVVAEQQDLAGNTSFYIQDHVRRPGLLALFLLFVVVVIAIARWHGLRSLIGLGASFVVIFAFVLPYIEQGFNPILIAIIGALFIVATTFYLSHGFNKKTHLAAAGTIGSLILTAFLAQIFINITKLTGFASEEVAFLQTIKGSDFNAHGLLLAGIILGALGVLDDITISQASVVQELRDTNKKISPQKLFLKAMNVGKDHIASLVNTLVLVYTGSALPLLLLFSDSNFSLSQLVNFEIIAQEIVVTLVASLGLVVAVPITTFLAVFEKSIYKMVLPDSSEDSRTT